MIESPPDHSIIKRDFKSRAKFWIENAYNLFNDENEISRDPNLQGFVRKTLNELVDEWNISIIPELFNSFIVNIFKLKPENQESFYQLGELYRSFNNILSFEILNDTFIYIKKKLLEGNCNSDWVDTPFLDSYYRSISVRQKSLRFNIRNLILLALRFKKRKIKDIRLKFK